MLVTFTRHLYSVIPKYPIPIHWQLGNVNWLLTIPNPKAPAKWVWSKQKVKKKTIDNKLLLACSQFGTTLLPSARGALCKIIILKSAKQIISNQFGSLYNTLITNFFGYYFGNSCLLCTRGGLNNKCLRTT
ncbi:unnamed protein product [Sphagnum troendelagicum]|uniref:Uncharacterized protein n=1 Tax=Sphagnum troendelagicum TaxID=128251 RepID=A0ABP0UD98_9BRYO